MPVRRLSLANFRVKIGPGAHEKTLMAALEKDETMKKRSETAWAKKLAAQARSARMTDFERFKVMVVREEGAKDVKAVLEKTKM